MHLNTCHYFYCTYQQCKKKAIFICTQNICAHLACQQHRYLHQNQPQKHQMYAMEMFLKNIQKLSTQSFQLLIATIATAKVGLKQKLNMVIDESINQSLIHLIDQLHLLPKQLTHRQVMSILQLRQGKLSKVFSGHMVYSIINKQRTCEKPKPTIQINTNNIMRFIKKATDQISDKIKRSFKGMKGLVDKNQVRIIRKNSDMNLKWFQKISQQIDVSSNQNKQVDKIDQKYYELKRKVQSCKLMSKQVKSLNTGNQKLNGFKNDLYYPSKYKKKCLNTSLTKHQKKIKGMYINMEKLRKRNISIQTKYNQQQEVKQIQLIDQQDTNKLTNSMTQAQKKNHILPDNILTISNSNILQQINQPAQNYCLRQTVFKNKLGQPQSIFITDQGDLYASQIKQHKIIVFRKQNLDVYQIVAGNNGRGSQTNQLNQPHGLYFHQQYLYIADTMNCRVVRWKQDAKQGIELISKKYLNRPFALILNRGYLYVSDTQNNRIIRYSMLADQVIELIGKDGIYKINLSYPMGLMFSKDKDQFYFVDSGNNRILLFTNQKIKQIKKDLGHPYNICKYDDNKLLVSDSKNYRILVIDFQQKQVKSYKVNGQPYGVAYDGKKRIYISFIGKKMISMLSKIKQ